MFKYLSPTLLTLVLGTAGTMPLWGATADERDQHAIALSKLMSAGMRLPAERQLKAYKEAGYPSGDPHLDKVLRYMFLDRFATELPEKEKAANEAELKKLRAELEPALKAGNLSTVSKHIFSGGGGTSTRMVNEIARVMHPEGPPPIVEPTDDKVKNVTRLLDALGKQAEEDFIAAVGKVLENKEAEDKMYDLPENSPEYKKTVNAAIDLRMEAMRPLVVAMISLRDAVDRGEAFGLDPAPVKAQLKKLFTTPRKQLDNKNFTDLLAAWEFEWGEYNPFIRINSGILLADAFLNGGKDTIQVDVVESALQAVIDFSVKDFRDPNLRAEAYRLKFMGWHALLHFYLAQKTPQSLKRGAAMWQEFQERAKKDPFMQLSKTPSRIASELGKVYIMAARVFKEKGDGNTANGLMAELVGAKPSNPYSHYAKNWIVFWTSGQKGANDNPWAPRPLAEEPAKAMLIARAFMSEAYSSADPNLARKNYLSAAVALRNGVLGLNAPTIDEKEFNEFAPQIYQLYAYVMYKMDMRYQAVVISQQGAKLLSEKMKQYEANKKQNPWKKKDKDGKLVWDESRITPLRVANDGMIYATQLYYRNRNTQAILNDTIEILRGIDPEAVGLNLLKRKVLAELEEKNYESAIREAKAITKEYPAEYLWVFGAISSARTGWMDKLIKDENKSGIERLTKEIEEDNKAISKRIDEELAQKDLTPERKKELIKAKSTIKVSEVESLIVKKQYESVIKLLDADFMKNLPSDDILAARMVRQLARATYEWHDSRKEELAKDPAALTAALKTYETVYHNLERGIKKLQNRNVDSTLDNAAKMLAIVFNRSVSMIARFQAAGNASKELIDLATVANRAFADLYEPTLNDSTPVPNILFIASTLWDVGEKKRAARQYERYLNLLEKNADVQAFITDGKPLVDETSEIVMARGEFKKAWEEIADLAYDSPEDKQAYETLAEQNWPKRKRKDIVSAIGKIKEFRQLMSQNRAVVDPGQFKQIEAAVNKFNDMLSTVAQQYMAESRLATFFRESGQLDKAMPYYDKHLKEDPLNPDNQMALVLATYQQALKGDPMPSKDELTKARGIAANIRGEKRGTPDKLGYWEAYTLVLEFSVMLGDIKVVNDSLSFLKRDRSDLSRDLVAPPVWGDDKRARRPLNALSVELAERFLDLYEKNGVTEKPAFKIVEVDVNGSPEMIFADPDAPAFETKAMVTPDDDEVTAIVAADGSTPAPKPPTPAEPPPTEEKPTEGTGAPTEGAPADEKKGQTK